LLLPVPFIPRVRFEGRKLMTLLEILILLLIAGICGSMGQAIVGASRGGFLVAIAVGFVGAAIGIWLARLLALPELLAVDVGGTAFPLTARPRW
jgi:uncharacterized membrane protein YeaQ/YmgE (transglycosylase-associated protein family)